MRIAQPLLLMIATGTLASGVAQGQGLFGLQPYPSGFAEQDEIETDRDSFTPSTKTAGFGRTIFEAAYSFIDNNSVPETHSYPELLLRMGVGDWLELRLGWNYEVGGAGSPVSGNVPSDFGDEGGIERESRMIYGMKAQLTNQDCYVPESSVILQGYVPTSGESTDPEMSATYVFGWTSIEGTTWDSAIRYSTSSEDGDDFNVWAPSSVVKVPVGESWKLHAEYFGIFSDGRSDESVQHYFSPGAHYLVNPNLEIGVRVGWGLNDEAPNFFSNAGVGWRY